MKKKQHYVPRFYLKNFSINRKKGNIVRCFNKETFKSYESKVEQIAMEKYFYDRTDPPKIENFFSKLESNHAGIYSKIISQKSIDDLTHKEKLVMSEYIFIQNERTRAARVRNRQITRAIYRHLEKTQEFPKFEKLSDDYKEWLLESRGEMAQLNIMFNPFEDDDSNLYYPDEIINSICSLGWILNENDSDIEFYTSDHPIFVYNPILDGKISVSFGSDSYKAEGVEIYFPLNPQLCLVLFDKEGSDYKNFGSKRKVIEKERNWINRQIIAKAHRTVFTKNNGFQFVKDFINEFPELKDPNRDRIYY
ncbi:hypothetical protein ES703_117224 [subsurface metagenome]